MKTEELARLVLEWEKVDDEVAKLGWGGDRDERWDNAKGAMVSVASEILTEVENANDGHVELEIVDGYGDDGGDGIGVSVHPASGHEKGFVSIRMIGNSIPPARLYFSDLCVFMSVLDGIETEAAINRVAVEESDVTDIVVKHLVFGDPSAGGYLIALANVNGRVGYVIGLREALGLRDVIRHAMLLVGCGLPSSMRKAGE